MPPLIYAMSSVHRSQRSSVVLQIRCISSSSKPKAIPRGSLLYVPSSSEKFLKSSLKSPSSTLTYDLEDSIHASAKPHARSLLSSHLLGLSKSPNASRPTNGLSVAVRPNSLHIGSQAEDDGTTTEKEVTTPNTWGRDDILGVWGSEGGMAWNEGAGPMMVLPKVDHPAMMTEIDHLLTTLRTKHPHPKTPLIASIESPEALLNIQHIASWRGRSLELVGLLFAAEDFCASSHILRSKSRQELLYARSNIVIAARAFGLAAIDMVCVDYKDLQVLREECEEGRRMGFDGKQAIHPSQVETIIKAFCPSPEEIHRAALILSKMKQSKDGAIGLKGPDGREEMIDAPMVLQARRIVREAREAGLAIPQL